MIATKNFLKGNIYLVIAFRIFIVFVLYGLCRLIFYYYNYSHFKEIDFHGLVTIFRGGFLFDASAIVYSNILYLLLFLLPFKFRYNRSFQKGLMILFFITNGITLAANLADTPYYEYVLQRTSMDTFSQFKNEENMGVLLPRFMLEYWYLILTWIFFMLVMIYLYRQVRIEGPKIKSGLWYYLSGTAMFLVGGVLMIGGARGGFKQFAQPIKMSNAWTYVRNPDDAALVLNTPFTLIHSLDSKEFERVKYFSNESELEKIFSPVHKSVQRPIRNDNIVILIIESLNREFIGSLNRDLEGGTYKGFTPFIDSLIPFSRVYMHSYANGRKSIDILPSLFCSLPRIGLPFVLNSSYYSNKLTSLPDLLKRMGYTNSFFHGAPNGSFGFQSFTNIIGMDKYFGMDEYNNDKDYDGSWGIWDEEYMQFFANTLNAFNPPFCATIFSISSHHPFNLPEKHKNSFEKTDFPLEQCVQYTDYSLRRFFKTASTMPWFQNTLFIITADHVSKNQRPEFMNEIGYFSVPIIFYHPDGHLTGIDSLTNAQQIDIMPTVLNYLGYNRDYIAFGKDLFNPESKNFAFNFLNDTYRLFLNDHLLIFNGRESHALYQVQNYRQLGKNIMLEQPSLRDSMENFTKAIVQQYINRMIEDRLSITEQDLQRK
jgi:phosphoglycerol transferase MdoB-like AlkP superfamily enzyme